MTGFILYLNIGRFEAVEDLEDHSTRLFQMTFGRNVRDDGFDPELPFFKSVSQERPSSLRGTLLHEIGHFIDYSNNFTGYRCSSGYGAGNESREVLTTVKEFSAFSWQLALNGQSDECGSYSLTFKEEFSHLRGFVSDHPKNKAAEIAKELEESSFSSVYAMYWPDEDFAEQFTFYHFGKGTFAELQNEVIFSFDRKENAIFEEKNENVNYFV